MGNSTPSAPAPILPYAGCQPILPPQASVRVIDKKQASQQKQQQQHPQGFSAHPDANPSIVHFKFSYPVKYYVELKFSSHVRNMSGFFNNHMNSAKAPKTQQEAEGMIIKYHHFMLLKAKYPQHSENIIPTTDIEKVWVAHLTRPLRYAKYCSEMISQYCPADSVKLHHASKLIPHEFLPNSAVQSVFKFHPNCNDARPLMEQLWKQEFSGDSYFNEAMQQEDCCATNYKVDYSKYAAQYQAELVQGNNPLFLANLVTCDEFSKEFEWIGKVNAAVPSNWLGFCVSTESLIKAYERFLYFTAKNSALALAPTYPMDLVWHTHMMFPIEYAHDTGIIFNGHTLDHDASYQPTAQDCQLFDQAWQSEFDSLPKDEHTFYTTY